METFRTQYLDGRLLQDPAAAVAWIDALLPDGAACKEPPPHPDHRETKDVELEYPCPDGGTGRVAVGSSPALGALKLLSDDLHSRFFWTPAAATLFVLTGERPRFNPAATSIVKGHEDYPNLNRIRMDLDPSLGPATVAQEYREVRHQVLGEGSRVKAMTPQHAELAVFAAKNRAKESRTWDQVRLNWNKRFPAWEYTNTKHLGRAARDDYKRVTGRRFELRPGSD